MKAVYTEIRHLADPYLQTRENDIHTDIATAMAYALIEKEGGDEEVIIPATMLHDVGWKTVPEELQLKAYGPGATDRALNRRHELEGARIAGEILTALHYDPKKIREILDIISGHDSRITALSLNDQIVKDADKLYRFTKEGFRIDSSRFGEERIAGLKRRGSLVEVWFFTDAAKAIARKELDMRWEEARKDGALLVAQK